MITLVDVVVFFPIAFIQGQVGRQISEFAIVVVISTLTSLFVSFTITPTLAGLWALRSHWKPWKLVDWFGERFDALRAWYTHRALPWSLRPRPVRRALLRGHVRARRSRWWGSASSAKSSFRRSTAARSSFSSPIRSERRSRPSKTASFASREEDPRLRPTSFANTAVAGAYAASFGGFVSQSNVGQVHVWLKDDRKHPTSYWVTEFQKLAKNESSRPTCTVVVVPSTGTGGGNAQPIDFLVTDVTGGDPTPYAQQSARRARDRQGCDQRQQHRHAARARDLDHVQSQESRRRWASTSDRPRKPRAPRSAATWRRSSRRPRASSKCRSSIRRRIRRDLTSCATLPIRASNGSIVYLGDIARFESTPTPPLMTRTDRNTVIHVDANYAPNSSLSSGREWADAKASLAPSAAEHRRASRAARATGLHASDAGRYRALDDHLGDPGLLADGGAVQQLSLAVHHHLFGAGRRDRRDRRARRSRTARSTSSR